MASAAPKKSASVTKTKKARDLNIGDRIHMGGEVRTATRILGIGDYIFVWYTASTMRLTVAMRFTPAEFVPVFVTP